MGALHSFHKASDSVVGQFVAFSDMADAKCSACESTALRFVHEHVEFFGCVEIECMIIDCGR
jgi:hypothetical protein